MSPAPEKFINEAGVRKINPAWKAWNQQQQQSSPQQQAPQMINVDTALPVVTSVADQQRHLAGAMPAESVKASAEMLQDDDIAASIGLTPDNVMAGLTQVFAKYEVPMGLVNKLMGISDFQCMEFIVDDSGSMESETDSLLPSGQPMTRWQEVHKRLLEMWEVLAQVPCPPAFVRFLNRSTVVEIKRNDGENPQAFFARIKQMLAPVFRDEADGSTPARERIAESLGRCPGQSVIRYFFGDGEPDGGDESTKAITQMLIARPNPAQNPFTFLSCTNEDDACEWMRECEEAAPYCSELDDYKDEQREVLQDQGRAFPYTYGMWLVSCCCASFSIFDLDCLDESAPMTKTTLDNLMGYQCSPEEYQYYFDSFLAAQFAKPTQSNLDKLKKDYIPFWKKDYEQFLHAAQAHTLPVVREYQKAVTTMKS